MEGAAHGASRAAPGTPAEPARTPDADFAALFARLREEACKTPEQRARESVLKKHDLSEEAYRRLPPDRRAGIDLEIAQEVRRVAEQRRAQSAARRGMAAA